jgi:hypothetical protein
MVVSSVYVPSSLYFDAFRMTHVFTWMALMMYVQRTNYEVGFEVLNMTSETYIGHPCFHSNLATFGRWANFQQILLKFPIVVFVVLTYLNVVFCHHVKLFLSCLLCWKQLTAGQITFMSPNRLV